MTIWSPDAWLAAWSFAARAHHGQLVPGSQLPYLVHVGAVAMEAGNAIAKRAVLAGPGAEQGARAVGEPDLVIQVALLHDVVEDTAVSVDEIAAVFGAAVAAGVAALSKDPAVGDKPAQMRDSLARILDQPREVWMVKLADRITNLQRPPEHWKADKIRRYRDEAQAIHAALGQACPVLGPRLLAKIANYAQHLSPSS